MSIRDPDWFGRVSIALLCLRLLVSVGLYWWLQIAGTPLSVLLAVLGLCYLVRR